MGREIFRYVGGIITLEISSRKNDVIRRFRTLLREKKQRDSEGVFALEGDHLVGEAIAAGLTVRCGLVTKKAMEKYPDRAKLLSDKSERLYVIPDDIAEYISDAKSPQGLFAEVEKPAIALPEAKRLVLLDGVQDPGNVGTIIRTAEALGIDGAVLSHDCADLYSPKTLRASMGSIFRLPCITCDMAEKINSLRAQGFTVYGSMLDETAEKLTEVSFPTRAAVVIGSEGSGISAQVKAACSGGLYIPISGAESLNAAMAASIILWELSK